MSRCLSQLLSVFSAALLVFFGLFMAPAVAQVDVSHPWVRATVEGQTTTGVYMSLQAAEELVLVGVHSPVASKVEIHATIKDGNIVRMRAVPNLIIKKDAAVELKPGGYHLMLSGLKHLLKIGDIVPLTLSLTRADGRRIEQKIDARVQQLEKSATH